MTGNCHARFGSGGGGSDSLADRNNPEIGAFRIRAKLKQMGITLSRATVGRIMAENRKLYGLGKPAERREEGAEGTSL